ncbi:hypothetical protein [Ferrovibrio terrae]|jgi:predicted lipoprotein with Yx(FWY)xxD motif|uniref:COG4315 family predicted lipoprotein n=1 Tax=Ferrovibrio terrae TaxID=2594003 RepID=UPI003138119B
MMMRNLFLAGVLTLGLAACATQTTAPAVPGNTALGSVLVDAKRMTLYTFDRDTMPGKSVCNGPCATNWPPLVATAGDMAKGDWSVITRDDGSKQWAYKGKPLYGWAKDTKPGDTTGDGFLNGAWHVAKP